jgi:prophage regulatory protein
VLLARKYPRSRSCEYDDIARGVFVPPIALGKRSVAWPENEVDAVVAARAAGANDQTISSLVAELVTARSGPSGGAKTGETLRQWVGKAVAL